MTDADTARNLRWQREVDGDKNKLAVWKLKAMGSAGLQFYAYMQPGEAFLVLGHSLSSIYSTTTDVASYHGKIILFMVIGRTQASVYWSSSHPQWPSLGSSVPSLRTRRILLSGMRTTAASMGSYGTPRPKTELESKTMSLS